MIVVYCRCGERLRVSENRAGRRLRCPTCGQPVLVPVADNSMLPAPSSGEDSSTKNGDDSFYLKSPLTGASQDSVESPTWNLEGNTRQEVEEKIPADESHLSAEFFETRGSRKSGSPPIKDTDTKIGSDNRNWWRESITLYSLSKTRYPALMAYRNLCVVVWYLLMTSLAGYLSLLLRGEFMWFASRVWPSELEILLSFLRGVGHISIVLACAGLSSIALLVPPECIKLVIDIESAIRENSVVVTRMIAARDSANHSEP